MSDDYFVYGVYADPGSFSKAFERIQSANFQDVIVARDSTVAVTHLSACIRNPLSHYLRIGGLAGAVIGGFAGAVNCPAVPYVMAFQVLTPLMAAVSGAVIGAYFGLWINGFLQGVDKPNVQPDVFTATVAAGSLVLGVRASGVAGRRAAVECLDGEGLIELIVKDERLAIEPEAKMAAGRENRAVTPKEVQLVA